MRMISFTKKKLRRIVIAASLAAATCAVGIGVVLSSVNTQAAERLLPIYRVERGDNKIAVTFDVAWENSNTEELLKILDDAGAKATFFITGDWCDRYPDDVSAFYNAGHEIGNHSDQHPHVEGINVNELISDTRNCSQKIEMLTGEKPTLYRAPYGEYDNSLLTTLDGMGLKVIQWDVDSIDWDKPSADEIVSRVMNGTESGSILLFHNDLENTTEALPQILTQLKDKGFEFVTVSDLIYHENYTIDANGEQIANVQSSLDLSEENIAAALSEHAEEIAAAGITEEQIAAAAAALKGGETLPAEIPAEISAVLAQYVSPSLSTTETSASAESSEIEQTSDTDYMQTDESDLIDTEDSALITEETAPEK